MFLGSHTLRKLEQTDTNTLHRPHRPKISIEIEEVIKALKATTMTRRKKNTPQKIQASDRLTAELFLDFSRTNINSSSIIQ